MFAYAVGLALALTQDGPNPNNLPIGSAGTLLVQAGRITSMKSGEAVSAEGIAKAADGKRFVFLGEQHATAPHQLLEANVIEALVRRGRKVVVGLEMYTRPKQSFLNQWTDGRLTEEDFLTLSDWKGQWGFPFAFYRPVFDVVRKDKLPFLALNVPRDWVRSVGKGGFAALTAEQKAQLPADMSLDNAQHRQVFDAMMGGHPGMSDEVMKNIYSAQVLWDEGMADTIAKDIAVREKDSKIVYVVIAGSGHMMYGQGINFRLQRRGLGTGLNVAMISETDAVTIAKGIADFVYVSPKLKDDGE